MIYELPVGREAWWGGWQTNGIVYYRTGLPLTITQTQGVQSTGTGNRPNRIGEGLADDPTIAQWFNPAHFVSPTDITGTYGDSGRNILRGPRQFNIDFSVIKGTKIGAPRHRVPRRGLQPPEPRAVRAAEHHLRQRGVRPDHGDAGQPVVRAVRHHGAQHPGRVQDQVLDTVRGAARLPYSGTTKGRAAARHPALFVFSPAVDRPGRPQGPARLTDARRRRGIPSGLRFRSRQTAFRLRGATRLAAASTPARDLARPAAPDLRASCVPSLRRPAPRRPRERLAAKRRSVCGRHALSRRRSRDSLARRTRRLASACAGRHSSSDAHRLQRPAGRRPDGDARALARTAWRSAPANRLDSNRPTQRLASRRRRGIRHRLRRGRTTTSCGRTSLRTASIVVAHAACVALVAERASVAALEVEIVCSDAGNTGAEVESASLTSRATLFPQQASSNATITPGRATDSW